MSTPTNLNGGVTHMNLEKEDNEGEIKQLVNELTNTDVKWDGQFIGIVATLNTSRAQRLVEIGEPAIPELIAAISDESKFAAAHAILTYISKVEFQTIPWNGLEVDFYPDGRTVFNPEQRFDLVKRWHRWYASKPRPNTFPSSSNHS